MTNTNNSKNTQSPKNTQNPQNTHQASELEHNTQFTADAQNASSDQTTPCGVSSPNSAASASSKKCRVRKKGVIAATCIAIVAIVGIAFWHWHETPGFCGTMCHNSMSAYSETFVQELGKPGVDKWGNAVSNVSAMLGPVHNQVGKSCLSCHIPTLPQQLGEVRETLTGEYYFPLHEVGVEQLRSNAGNPANTGDQFCLNSGCHIAKSAPVTTRADLQRATKDLPFNPHSTRHGDIACSSCHKSHRASVMYCTQCHSEAYDIMPDGWVDYKTGEEINARAHFRA